jgi:5-oxoprolinase (ATP-hydrolysing) subunit C
MNAMWEIVRPGLQTIIVAAPRTGHRAIGVGLCGALDAASYARANALVGNAPDAPALEIPYGAFTARCTHPMLVAVTGADCCARFDGVHLVVEPPRCGVRSYVAVRGGFDVPVVLGSRTTDLRGGFGGWHGRALRVSDALPIVGSGESEAKLQVATQPYAASAVIRAVDRNAPPEFWTREWTASPASNRMGTRLQGEALNGGGDVDSHGVFPGVVQLPADGEPIVLLADAQTTGGYRAIASVIAADLGAFAQLPAGAAVRFKNWAIDDAH